MKDDIAVGIIGLGQRGIMLLEDTILPQGVRVAAVSDDFLTQDAENAENKGFLKTENTIPAELVDNIGRSCGQIENKERRSGLHCSRSGGVLICQKISFEKVKHFKNIRGICTFKCT